MKLQEKPRVKTLGDYARLAVEKHFQKILKHEDDVVGDRDPEALHQMRVGMRRLRSSLAGFASALTLPKSARDKEIGKIASTLGTLRDIDVLQAELKNRYQPTLPKSEQKLLETALDNLAEKREKALEKVREILKHKSYKQLKQSLSEWLKEPAYQEIAQLPIYQVLPDLLLPQVSQLLLHPGWLVGTEVKETEVKPIKELNPEAVEKEIADRGELLHSLRKVTKRVRYQMELFADFYGATYQAYLEDIKALQEILGQIQDSFVLGEFLQEALSQESDRLPTFTEQLKRNRYEAWQKWQSLQLRYLNAQIRQSFHSEILRPQENLSNGKAADSTERDPALKAR